MEFYCALDAGTLVMFRCFVQQRECCKLVELSLLSSRPMNLLWGQSIIIVQGLVIILEVSEILGVRNIPCATMLTLQMMSQ